MLGVILMYAVIGLIVGALARLIMPGPDPMGIFATMLLGIVGSLVGGLIGSALFRTPGGGGLSHPGFLFSLLGAVIVLFFWRLAHRRRTI